MNICNKIISAYNYGEVDVIKDLVSQNFKSNKKTEIPLLTAIKMGNTKAVEILLSYGANPNQICWSPITLNTTPLIAACEYEYTEIVKLLLYAGAKVNYAFEDRRVSLKINALITASRVGAFEIAKLLVENGANPNYSVNDETSVIYSFTPLLFVAINGNQQLFEFLLSENVDINVKTRGGDNCLTLASAYGKKNIVELLLSRGFPCDNTNNRGNNALILASREGYYEIVEMLIVKRQGLQPLVETEINVNEKNIFGTTALALASLHGYVDIIKLLLVNGANVFDRAEDGKTPIDIAHNQETKDILEKWSITMLIIIFEELQIKWCVDFDFFTQLGVDYLN